MVNGLWTKAAVAAGGLALSLTTGLAVASAQPDLSPLVNTNCSYQQAVDTLNATPGESAAAARQALNNSPVAQSWLQQFLASPIDKRQRMAQSIATMSSLQQYLGVMNQVAASC